MSDEILQLSELARSVRPGLYEHFKGGKYRVLGVARNSENAADELVLYQSIKTGYFWVRPVAMFLETVERDSYRGPRFKYVGA